MKSSSALLSPSSKKKKKNTRKSFLYFNKWNFLVTRLNNIFIFWEIKLSRPKIKKFLIFSQKSFSYISRNGNFLKESSNISGGNCCSYKTKKNTLKNVLYFGQWNFLALKNLINLFYTNKTFLYS